MDATGVQPSQHPSQRVPSSVILNSQYAGNSHSATPLMISQDSLMNPDNVLSPNTTSAFERYPIWHPISSRNENWNRSAKTYALREESNVTSTGYGSHVASCSHSRFRSASSTFVMTARSRMGPCAWAGG